MTSGEWETAGGESAGPGIRSADSVACLVAGAGFLLRMIVAGSTFLDSDEAFHFVLGNQHSLELAYRASLSSAHPPLLILLIYSLRGLGNSEFMLRLPSVMAGTLSCWFGYKWLASIADRQIALTGLVLLSFSPPIFALEAELRQYSLLLLCTSAALYYFEKAVQRRSWTDMGIFSLSLWLALASHYGALLFAVSMGAYALLRFMQLGWSARLLGNWGLGQLAFLGLALFFYRTHVPVVEQGLSDSWLRKSFYHRGDHVVLFLATNSYRFFHFLFGQPVIGSVMLLLFIAGVIELNRCGHMGGVKFGKSGLVILIAFALSFVLSVAGFYPFGGTRHSVFLLPFIVLAIAAGARKVLQGHAQFAPVLAGAAVCFCSIFPAPAGPHIQPPNQNIVLMRRAAEYVHSAAATGLVLVDQQTVFPFRYYFCREESFPFAANPPNFPCGSYEVHKSSSLWDLSGEELGSDLAQTRMAFSAPATAKIMVFQTGWSVGGRSLLNTLKVAGCRTPMLGKNILTCLVQ